jgi:hypothetical protein
MPAKKITIDTGTEKKKNRKPSVRKSKPEKTPPLDLRDDNSKELTLELEEIKEKEELIEKKPEKKARIVTIADKKSDKEKGEEKTMDVEPSFMEKLKKAGIEEANIEMQTGIKEKPTEKINLASPRKLGLYRKIAVSFIILTILLIAVVFYFTMVKLNIVIIPNQEKLPNSLIVDINNQTDAQASTGDTVNGRIEKINVSEQKEFDSTGSEVIGNDLVGKITVYNNYIKNQPLVASTRLLTPDNKLYRLKETINVPAGGSIEAEVTADTPGKDAETGPTRFTIPGLWAGLQDKIYAESKDGIKYEQQVKKTVEQANIDDGIAELKKLLIEKVKNQVSEQYKDFKQVIYNIDDSSILTEIGAKVGDEVSKFPITETANVQVVAFNDDSIKKLARDKLTASLPSDKELIDLGEKTFTYSLTNVSTDGTKATINASFEGVMILKSDSKVVDRNALAGLSKTQIQEYFKKINEIAGFELHFTPSFIQRAPNLVDRITIEIKR